MSSMHKSLPYLALLLLGVFLGSLLGGGSSSTPAVGPTPVGAARGDRGSANLERELAEIRGSLRRIEERLATLEVSSSSGDSAVSRVPVASGSNEELAALVRELQSTIEERLAGDGVARNASALEQARLENPETKWDAVGKLIDLWTTDPAAARQQARLLTPVELLKRFGPPSETYGGNWFYREGWDPVAETFRAEAWFGLKEGYVTEFDVAMK